MMDGYVYIPPHLLITMLLWAPRDYRLCPFWPQVCGWHAERRPSSAWRGQLGDGSHAEEVLEDQAGPHQSHGQEGGRVRGGLGCWPGCKAGGRRGEIVVYQPTAIPSPDCWIHKAQMLPCKDPPLPLALWCCSSSSAILANVFLPKLLTDVWCMTTNCCFADRRTILLSMTSMKCVSRCRICYKTASRA